ncbi:MAG: NAD(P)-dependent oxidoreductase [Bacteroidetes bacterium]|nr:NAD(P)-dependent oxidoreductase [Bacteroidota bacterium]
MEKIKNKIAITGASGFIGRHLLEDIDPDAYDLVIITRNAEKKIEGLPFGSTIRQADLSDFDSLSTALIGVNIIINIAAEVRNASKLEETNITGTRNLIRAAIENNVSRIIHLSSVGVVGAQYNKTPLRIDELSECFPKNEYERTKLESERLFREAHGRRGLSVVIVRPTNVFGEHHPFNALLNLISHVNNGKILLSTVSAVVNYVYVKDLCAILLHLIKDDKTGIFNVGSPVPLKDFIDIIAAELGKKANKKLIPQILVNFIEMLRVAKLRAVSNGIAYDDSKLKSFFDYPYGVEQGLNRTIEHYKKHNLIK